MTFILARQNRATLERFLTSRVLLAFDFDGTLAPVVVDRARARMRRRTLRLLERVCRLYPCAVISGRRRDDVLTRLEGLPMRHVLGNHGFESEDSSTGDLSEVEALRTRLDEALDEASGVELEDKVHSLALHYRRARDRRRARQTIERLLAGIGGQWRIVPGKLVFDVMPVSAPHKGAALVRLTEAEAVDAAIYLGDDSTDEDVFRLSPPAPLLPIRIGRSRRSAAPYFIRDQRELDVFLDYVTRVRN